MAAFVEAAQRNHVLPCAPDFLKPNREAVVQDLQSGESYWRLVVKAPPTPPPPLATTSAVAAAPTTTVAAAPTTTVAAAPTTTVAAATVTDAGKLPTAMAPLQYGADPRRLHAGLESRRAAPTILGAFGSRFGPILPHSWGGLKLDGTIFALGGRRATVERPASLDASSLAASSTLASAAASAAASVAAALTTPDLSATNPTTGVSTTITTATQPTTLSATPVSAALSTLALPATKPTTTVSTSITTAVTLAAAPVAPAFTTSASVALALASARLTTTLAPPQSNESIATFAATDTSTPISSAIATNLAAAEPTSTVLTTLTSTLAATSGGGRKCRRTKAEQAAFKVSRHLNGWVSHRFNATKVPPALAVNPSSPNPFAHVDLWRVALSTVAFNTEGAGEVVLDACAKMLSALQSHETTPVDVYLAQLDNVRVSDGQLLDHLGEYVIIVRSNGNGEHATAFAGTLERASIAQRREVGAAPKLVVNAEIMCSPTGELYMIDYKEEREREVHKREKHVFDSFTTDIVVAIPPKDAYRPRLRLIDGKPIDADELAYLSAASCGRGKRRCHLRSQLRGQHAAQRGYKELSTDASDVYSDDGESIRHARIARRRGKDDGMGDFPPPPASSSSDLSSDEEDDDDDESHVSGDSTIQVEIGQGGSGSGSNLDNDVDDDDHVDTDTDDVSVSSHEGPSRRLVNTAIGDDSDEEEKHVKDERCRALYNTYALGSFDATVDAVLEVLENGGQNVASGFSEHGHLNVFANFADTDLANEKLLPGLAARCGMPLASGAYSRLLDLVTLSFSDPLLRDEDLQRHHFARMYFSSSSFNTRAGGKDTLVVRRDDVGDIDYVYTSPADLPYGHHTSSHAVDNMNFPNRPTPFSHTGMAPHLRLVMDRVAILMELLDSVEMLLQSPKLYYELRGRVERKYLVLQHPVMIGTKSSVAMYVTGADGVTAELNLSECMDELDLIENAIEIAVGEVLQLRQLSNREYTWTTRPSCASLEAAETVVTKLRADLANSQMHDVNVPTGTPVPRVPKIHVHQDGHDAGSRPNHHTQRTSSPPGYSSCISKTEGEGGLELVRSAGISHYPERRLPAEQSLARARLGDTQLHSLADHEASDGLSDALSLPSSDVEADVERYPSAPPSTTVAATGHAFDDNFDDDDDSGGHLFSSTLAASLRAMLRNASDAITLQRARGAIRASLFPKPKPKHQRWFLPSKGGAIARASLGGGMCYHGGVPGTLRPSVIMYLGEDVVQVSIAERWVRDKYGPDIDPWWTAADKKRARGTHSATFKSKETVDAVGLTSASVLSVLPAKCVTLPSVVSNPFESTSITDGYGATVSTLQSASTLAIASTSIANPSSVVTLPILVPCKPIGSRTVHFSSSEVTIDKRATVEDLRQLLARGFGANSVRTTEVEFVVDARMANREQYADRVRRHAASKLLDDDARVQLESTIDGKVDDVAEYLLAKLVPEHCERVLVDLEFAAEGGAASTFAQHFWHQTHHAWLPGDFALDRSTITFSRLLPSHQESWASTSATPSRSLLAFAIVSQLVNVATWSELPASSYDDLEGLRRLLESRRVEANLPQTADALEKLLNLRHTVGVQRTPFPKTIKNLKQLRRIVTADYGLAKHEIEECMTKLAQTELRRVDRRRFQNHLLDGLLRLEGQGKAKGIGILADLLKFSEDKCKRILESASVSTFTARLQNVSGVGKLAALKVACILQLHGYCPIDDVPKLGCDESAFCVVRAATMNVLYKKPDGTAFEGPLYLKKSRKKRKNADDGDGGEYMDELNYVNLSQKQVATIVMYMAEAWPKHARAWWAATKVKWPQLTRWEPAVTELLFGARTILQVESTLCEQGNRQTRARAVHNGELSRLAKGTWKPRGAKKDFSRVRFPTRKRDARGQLTNVVVVCVYSY